ncbi:MAG: SEL1-like repeat protein [Thermoguttaceae bacterium]|nr:SEL1-like repeat protein [Thermoguttaceae bacterium]
MAGISSYSSARLLAAFAIAVLILGNLMGGTATAQWTTGLSGSQQDKEKSDSVDERELTAKNDDEIELSDNDENEIESASEDENDDLLAGPSSGNKVNRGAWRVFVVGTNDYDKAPQLSFCVNDIDGLTEQLTNAGVPSGNIVALRSREQKKLTPTKVNIEREYKKFLDSLNEDDLAMVYLSGHGVEERDSNGKVISYYAPEDCDPKNIASTCVSINQMIADLDDRPAKTKWMIVDACRESEGKGLGEGRSLMTTVDAAPKSIILLQSCESGEVSYEDPKEEHGIFTKSLIEALVDNDNPADTNGDFTLTFTEMFTYVHQATGEKAKALKRSAQTPYLSGDFTDFPLMTSLRRLDCSKEAWIKAEGHYKRAQELKNDNIDLALVDAKLAAKCVPGEQKYQDLVDVLDDLGDGSTDKRKKAVEKFQRGVKFWYGLDDVKINERQAYELISEAAEYSREASGFLSYIQYNGACGVAPKREASYLLASNPGVQNASSIAIWVLGDCYRQGISVPRNISKSDELFKQAFERFSEEAKKGDLVATTQMGMCYYQGTGVEQSYEKAVECWRKAAEGGVPRAMDSLGLCYRAGRGVKKDEDAARRWFEKASEYDYPSALVSLGECYQDGIGVEQDLEEAEKFFERAAKADSPEGMNALGVYYFQQGDDDEGLSWLKKAERLGAPSAINNLGIYYEHAGELKYAKRYYKEAQELGYPDAMINLANYYYNREGNLAEAQKWYQKAANIGSSQAMVFLGNCLLERGKYEESVKWYKKAEKLNNGEAVFQLANLHYEGKINDKKDYVQAGKLFKKSGDLGVVDGYFRVGEMLENGQTKDEKKYPKVAFEYYKKVGEHYVANYPNVNRNLRKACSKVAEGYRKGYDKDASKDEAKRQATYWQNAYNRLK